MDRDKLLSQITISDLYAPLNSYAEIIGIENLFRLMELTGGRKIYLPKPEAMFKEIVKRMIIADYQNGSYTMNSLALKYGVCVKTVFNYIRK